MLLDSLFALNAKDALTNVFDLKQFLDTQTQASATLTSATSNIADADRCFIITSISVRAQPGAAQKVTCWTLQYIDDLLVTPGTAVLGGKFDGSVAAALAIVDSWSGQFIIRPGGSFALRCFFDAGAAANQAIFSVQYFNAPRGQMAFS